MLLVLALLLLAGCRSNNAGNDSGKDTGNNTSSDTAGDPSENAGTDDQESGGDAVPSGPVAQAASLPSLTTRAR